MLTRTIMSSLKSLARRYQHLTAEIDVLEADLEQLVLQINPGLAQTKGIGTVTAAQLLITAGGNTDRLKSEASFAALCGTSPIPASSGFGHSSPAGSRRRPACKLRPPSNRPHSNDLRPTNPRLHST